jgi:hypothetical protein
MCTINPPATKRSRFPEIPNGDYCYTWVNGEQYICPYWGYKMVEGTNVSIPYCSLLKQGSIPAAVGSILDEDYNVLLNLWGRDKTEEEIADDLYYDKETPEAEIRSSKVMDAPKEWNDFLLWDQCKGCLINTDDVAERAYWSHSPYDAAEMEKKNPNDYLLLTIRGEDFLNGCTIALRISIPRGGSLLECIKALNYACFRAHVHLMHNLYHYGPLEPKFEYGLFFSDAISDKLNYTFMANGITESFTQSQMRSMATYKKVLKNKELFARRTYERLPKNAAYHCHALETFAKSLAASGELSAKE